MSKPRRVFSKEFKLQIIEEIEDGTPVTEICRRYELQRSTVWKWRQSAQNAPDDPFPGRGKRNSKRSESQRIAELERLAGRLTLENDFLKNALRRMREQKS
ncbi:MAG: transposase [Thermoleophilia bacterium]